eukprot:2400929-Amphidinium_carterae.1
MKHKCLVDAELTEKLQLRIDRTSAEDGDADARKPSYCLQAQMGLLCAAAISKETKRCCGQMLDGSGRDAPFCPSSIVIYALRVVIRSIT